MEKLINGLSRFPFGTVQFRLWLYLFTAGSIPILCIMLIFYRQASDSSRDEASAYVQTLHGQLARRVELELAQLSFVGQVFNNDLLVQSKLSANSGTNAPRDETQERALGQRIDYLIGQQKRALPSLTEWCFVFDDGSSICSDRSMTELQKYEPPISRTDARFTMSDPRGGDPAVVRWTGPLTDPVSGVVKGFVSVGIDVGSMLAVIRSADRRIASFALIDAEGHTMTSEDANYRMNANNSDTPHEATARTVFTGDYVSDSLNLDGRTAGWQTQLIVRNRFLHKQRDSLTITLLVSFSLLLLLSVPGSMLISRVVTGPVHTLRALMKRAESGDLKAYWTSKGTRELNELGLSYNQMLNRLEDTIKQVIREQTLKKEAEMEALQYQLNPHFLYNTLNTIKWVAKIHNTPQISDAVSSLVRLLQASLGKKGDFIPLREEIQLVHDYMAIQTFRYGDHVKLITNIDPLAAGCLVPRLLLQPLVENALIHGIGPGELSDGRIQISAWLERDMLLCQVEDNGVGIGDDCLQEIAGADRVQASRGGAVKEKMNGIGLKHIREKIKLYYGPDYKLLVFGKPGEGTVVRMSLPVHPSDD